MVAVRVRQKHRRQVLRPEVGLGQGLREPPARDPEIHQQPRAAG